MMYSNEMFEFREKNSALFHSFDDLPFCQHGIMRDNVCYECIEYKIAEIRYQKEKVNMTSNTDKERYESLQARARTASLHEWHENQLNSWDSEIANKCKKEDDKLSYGMLGGISNLENISDRLEKNRKEQMELWGAKYDGPLMGQFATDRLDEQKQKDIDEVLGRLKALKKDRGEVFNAFTKNDTDKPMLAHLPWEELEAVARVLDYGAAKYARDNWKKPCNWMRLMSAALRHIKEWCIGRTRDPETEHLEGVTHIHHAICSLLFLAHHQRHATGTDDRSQPTQ